MTEVKDSECVQCRNERTSGPKRDGRQCRSCGAWHGDQHHPGCPVGAAAVAEAKRAEVPKPKPILAAQKEAPAAEPPMGANVETAPKPKRRLPRRKR